MPLADVRGGAEATLDHLIQHRAVTGVEWLVVFLENGPMVERFRAEGVEVHIVEAGRLRDVLKMGRCIVQLAHLFQTRRVDAVLSWMTKAQLYAGPAAWWAGCPAVWFQHAFPADVHWMDRLATALPAEGVLTCSQAGADLQSTLRPRRPTRVVHPGVDLSRFDPDAFPPKDVLRETLGLPTGVPIVGIVGRLQRWKGIHVFIDALAKVRTAHPDVVGAIVGGKHPFEPEYSESLRRQIDQRGLSDAIMMPGFQTNIAEWMHAFDVFVHASDREPFGLVVVEAMAMGLPVVASDAAGPTEIITEGVDGLFAPFEDDAALADQIRRYLDHPAWAVSVGTLARNRASDFSAPGFAERVASVVRTFAGSAADRNHVVDVF